MVKVSVKNKSGKEIKTVELPQEIFDVPANDVLLHQVYVALMSNIRQAIAHTKTRGERAGSGKKPWRQKGTGRARVGSVRTPVWRKGGVTFGPRNTRVFAKKANEKMRQKATMIALSEKIRSGKLMILDTLLEKEQKTKAMVGTLAALSLTNKSVLFGMAPDEQATARALRNLPKTESGLAVNMNVRQLLDHEYVVLSEASVESLKERFSQWQK